MTGSDNLAKAHLALAIITQRDLPLFQTLAADEIVLEIPYTMSGLSQVFEGKEACLTALEALLQRFSVFNLALHEIYECDAEDTIIFEATSLARWRDEDRFYQNRHGFVFRFRDDKLVLWRDYHDPRRISEGQAPAASTYG